MLLVLAVYMFVSVCLPTNKAGENVTVVMGDEYGNRTSIGVWKALGPPGVSGHEQGRAGSNTSNPPEVDSPGGMHCQGGGASLLSDALTRVVAAINA